MPFDSDKIKFLSTLNEANEAYTSIILQHQDSTGSFPATGEDAHMYSNFRWVRDSSYTTLGLIYKLQSASEAESEILMDAIEKNFEWWFNIIDAEEEGLEYLISTESISATEFHENALPARFTKDGLREPISKFAEDNWPNVQLDGYGTLLAVFGKYIEQTNRTSLVESYEKEISLLTSYLSKFATFSNYDMWEDSRFFGENGCLHISTLACIYAGLSAVDEMSIDSIPSKKNDLSSIKFFVEDNFIDDNGEFVKYIQKRSDETYFIPEDPLNNIDSSMLLLSSPFNGSMYHPDHPLMKNVTERIERYLNEGGGVKRYPGDEFYDGGRWPLLSALQGLSFLQEGNLSGALRNYEWILDMQDHNNHLIEQVPDNPESEMFKGWYDQWGKPTTPLLMGHGVTIVFIEELIRYIQLQSFRQ